MTQGLRVYPQEGGDGKLKKQRRKRKEATVKKVNWSNGSTFTLCSLSLLRTSVSTDMMAMV